MPAPVIAAIIIAAGTTGAAAIAAHGQTSAAHTNADAANRAGDLQAQGAKDALDFQKSEAARAQHNYEVTQRATYEQWAAQQRRLSAVGVLAGLAPREIPAYVDPTGQSSSGSSGQGLESLQISNAPVDYIKDLLNKGTSIPDAIQQANTKFGRTHGNEFVYDEKTKTIGFPNGDGGRFGGYLTDGDQGWGFVQHNAQEGGGSARGQLSGLTQQTLGSYGAPPAATGAMGAAGTLGSYGAAPPGMGAMGALGSLGTYGAAPLVPPPPMTPAFNLPTAGSLASFFA